MENKWIQRAGKVLEGKGFYIVLLLCAAALGVSGYYLFSGLGTREVRPVSGGVTVTVTPTPRPVPAATPSPLPTAAPTPTAPPVPSVKPTAEGRATPAPAAVTATASVFTWPVKGEVIRGYTVETLAYDETMADYRIHDGVDIAATLGEAVMAPAGGTVSDIFTDDLMGTTVVILHADGVMSATANLAATPTVEVGDTVRTGDVIGSVGETAIAESAQASHIHLTMTKDGVSVDPTAYLP